MHRSFLLVCFAALMVATAAPAAAQLNVAVIDVQRVVTESDPGKEALQKLKELQDVKIDEGRALQQELTTLQEQMSKQRFTLSEARLAELSKEIEDKQIALQRFQDDAERELDEARRIAQVLRAQQAVGDALGAAVEYVSGIGLDAIAERILSLNMYLTFRLGREAFEVLSPGDEHRSGETLVRLPDPPRALAFLQERHIHVTEKPEGLRISTHFYNTEAEIDACVDALVEYRELLLP